MPRARKLNVPRDLSRPDLSEQQETLRGLGETLPVTLHLSRKTITPSVAQMAGLVGAKEEPAEPDVG
jgi:hypothetical protein